MDMNASLAAEKANVQLLERKARDIQTRIDMMHIVEQVQISLCEKYQPSQ